VEGLAIAPAAEAEMQMLEVARASAGRGLEGDRYAAGAGTFTPRGDERPGYDLTIITADRAGVRCHVTRRSLLTSRAEWGHLPSATKRGAPPPKPHLTHGGRELALATALRCTYPLRSRSSHAQT
jgi:hypothetical protein